MTKVYRKLNLNRVDFVDVGANQMANITLAKRAQEEERRMADTKDTLPEAVAKRLADLEAEKVALSERVAKAEASASANEKAAKEQAETVAKMLEDRAKDQALTVAKSFPKLPGKVDEIAHLLFVAKRAFDDTDFTAFTTLLKAADAQIAAGKLFGVTGQDTEGEAASDLDKLVQKRMAEHKEPQHIALLRVTETPEGKAAYREVTGRN